jgi:hypothetical protein
MTTWVSFLVVVSYLLMRMLLRIKKESWISHDPLIRNHSYSVVMTNVRMNRTPHSSYNLYCFSSFECSSYEWNWQPDICLIQNLNNQKPLKDKIRWLIVISFRIFCMINSFTENFFVKESSTTFGSICHFFRVEYHDSDHYIKEDLKPHYGISDSKDYFCVRYPQDSCLFVFFWDWSEFWESRGRGKIYSIKGCEINVTVLKGIERQM